MAAPKEANRRIGSGTSTATEVFVEIDQNRDVEDATASELSAQTDNSAGSRRA